jgi:hypothetical protein
MDAPHIVLLGDSILDNGAYTRGEPDVVSHLRDIAPQGWQATLCAVDGATIDALPAQLRRVPHDATHLVVSIGGNDVLSHCDLLSLRVGSMLAALEQIATRADEFAGRYRSAVQSVKMLEKKTMVCTIYNGQLESQVQTAARIALGVFNDVILRTAVELDIPAIELRSICQLPDDYANPIEPSGSGGRKIAEAICAAVNKLRS